MCYNTVDVGQCAVTQRQYPGSPAQTNCRDTAALTQESSHTNVSSVRRSLLAVTTCPNTSKSIAFPGATEQRVPQTEPTTPRNSQTVFPLKLNLLPPGKAKQFPP
ncbi:hypothetical protein JZ751_028711 [Albula glossodonta]|uniref:Uncharacterized protein n=1 Tax=Albula glossodonta TaxID=121402 RepID=A0A8T2MW23_9TELE|nr:hypothetical protein JZ751_028711 [Albula glossodonta]